jgi:hypothetical protein
VSPKKSADNPLTNDDTADTDGFIVLDTYTSPGSNKVIDLTGDAPSEEPSKGKTSTNSQKRRKKQKKGEPDIGTEEKSGNSSAARQGIAVGGSSSFM